MLFVHCFCLLVLDSTNLFTRILTAGSQLRLSKIDSFDTDDFNKYSVNLSHSCWEAASRGCNYQTPAFSFA
ncbi:hypothetical protein BDV98DRAFT_575529 [Pterulicium gracile]|uniref:Secreted protein n=1 Tax=Pterulicium gracile TaxID=1884261 RepID=A0A5C3Q5P5_9AGAR|nr:hypothetical protein BDV98DRAFT_575529 [Pterula gracilis]